MLRFLACAFFILSAIGVCSADQDNRLPTGQILTPAGVSIPIEGTMAANIVRIPHRPWVAIICSGARQSLSIVNIESKQVLAAIQYQVLNKSNTNYVPTGSVYYGLCVSLDGKTLFAARGSEDRIASYQIGDDGSLTETGDYNEPLAGPKSANFPAGIAIDPLTGTLYASNNLSDTLAVFQPHSGSQPSFYPVKSYPLAVAFNRSSGEVYVSSERESCLSIGKPGTPMSWTTLRVGSHPDSLLLSSDSKLLYVANGDSDSVSIVDTIKDVVVRTLLLRPTSVEGLPGATPTGLALSPDQRTLYVTLADMDAVAVVKLTETRSDGEVIGYIPVGWYPTAITTDASGKTLIVANAKGSTAAVGNPGGPNPVNHIGRYKDHDILTSTLSIVPVPTQSQLTADTNRVLADNSISAPVDADAKANQLLIAGLPIKHVIYIIKENRTYDEVLGDMAQGNGDPSLTLFGRTVTPNLHALSSQFVLLDNFYCCAEVSPDGWNWSTSGLAEEYTQRTVPEAYSEDKNGPRREVRSYDYEGENRELAVSDRGIPDVAESPGGYIWDAVGRAGLTYRDYGAFLSEDGDRPAKPALLGHTSMIYAPFDMKYADSDVYAVNHLPSPGQDSFVPATVPSRYSAWKFEFDAYVRNGNLPAFELLRLPRDHTSGTTPGQNTPQAMAADNDYAVAEIVQTVSHSRYWKSTAIFVLEDDAQNGPDHVDCHRSTAYVISPFVKRQIVDHHFYNTDSVLRTIEILLHIPPMTRLDASAPPLGVFTAHSDLSPYIAIVPDFSVVTARNGPQEYGASLSMRMNFAVADDAPEEPLNDILWHSIKGAIAMPQPRHSVLGY